MNSVCWPTARGTFSPPAARSVPSGDCAMTRWTRVRRAAWRDAVELGWSAIPFPEDFGGLDFGCKGLGPIFESMGRNLSASPLLSSVVLGGSLLHLAGNSAQRTQWLQAVIGGEQRLALAVDERSRHDPSRIALEAKAEGQGYRLHGDKYWVVDGLGVDAYVVAARTSGQPGDTHGISLFLVPADTQGLTVSALSLIDSRNSARLQLEDVQLGSEALLGTLGEGWAALETALDRGRTCLAAELLGMAEQLFETTLDTSRPACSSTRRSALSRSCSIAPRKCTSTWRLAAAP